MIDPRNVAIVAAKELRDAARNRWLLLYTGIFTVLAVALSFLSTLGVGTYGHVGYGRTAAVLVNLVALIVPLMALNAGASSLAGERERGTLAYLLAQPIDRSEVLAGKFVGLSAALTGALAGGFGVSAAALAASGTQGQIAGFLELVGLAIVLAVAMLAVGLFLSAASPRASVAGGIAVVLWLSFVLLTDLGLMGGSLIFRLGAPRLLGLALVNPVQVFKLAVLARLNPSLDMLGPAGVYATRTFGVFLPAIFAGSLLAWIALPLAGAFTALRRTSRP
jgi:ABC-type transport system involved in multi-copper enzyme maturation permease subunit